MKFFYKTYNILQLRTLESKSKSTQKIYYLNWEMANHLLTIEDFVMLF